ncbi:LRR 8 domain containing protein [Asbolus verrucosus]|uniref:LRR 8 domain containing protein n=1 Tax=Asbolus verrucosus TaxID=1661398 RepID=A0A482W391_ASBVE|nr:LRR 8 domain containing protein [Asbolus verrucosus]
MTVISRSGERYQTLVTGCIQRVAFEATISDIYVVGQPIPLLETDAVRHMRQLKTISFKNCSMREIQPAVFRNVPRLRLIEIVFNDLGEIASGIFSTLEQLEVLRINNNKIATIQDGAFGNSVTLKEVDCGHNLLEEWTARWFGNSTNVEVMDFRFNRIRNLPKGAFGDFRQLKFVNFDHNELEIIHPEAFGGAAGLDFLGLRYNKLAAIDPGIFPDGLTIKTLSIGANHLNFLPTRVMTKIAVNEMEVDGNPWKCPCLERIFRWLHETNAAVKQSESCKGRDMPVCSFPPTYTYTCRENVEEEVTKAYLGKLKLIAPPLNQYCARLD